MPSVSLISGKVRLIPAWTLAIEQLKKVQGSLGGFNSFTKTGKIL